MLHPIFIKLGTVCIHVKNLTLSQCQIQEINLMFRNDEVKEVINNRSIYTSMQNVPAIT